MCLMVIVIVPLGTWERWCATTQSFEVICLRRVWCGLLAEVCCATTQSFRAICLRRGAARLEGRSVVLCAMGAHIV